MPRNRLNLNLAEWKADLAKEPAALATDSTPAVQSAADQAAAALRAAYPTGPTGNLRAGVRVRRPVDGEPAIASAEVISGAPHAHLYEGGTRHTRPKPTFYPITDQYGRDKDADVTRVVESHGYTVSGALE